MMYQSQTPYSMQYPSAQGSNQGQQPTFSGSQFVPNLSAAANTVTSLPSGSNSASSTNTFKAPAHRHAHHLHSIPPKEKSTRTLIIDHMLWVHARTRHAQARAELGMTDRTGGQNSPNYAHRERPENYDEDEEQSSDGEECNVLYAREGDNNDGEDEQISHQDLVLAGALRLRAESLEKVVTGMLDQPPPVHLHFDGDPLTPPSSLNQKDPLRQHILPNGVRVRITLGTIINDLFARQAPPEPYRHHHHPVPILVSGDLSGVSSQLNSPVIPRNTSVPVAQIPPMEPLPPTVASAIPVAVLPLSTISAGSPAFRATLSVTGEFPSPSFPASSMPNPTAPHTPSTRVRSLYAAGTERSITDAQPSSRCPRHLHTGCDICVEAKSGCKILRARTGSTAGWGAASPGKNSNDGGARSSHNAGVGGRGPATEITGWQDGSGIGSGLARPDVDGSVLRRRSWSALALPESNNKTTGTGAGNTKLSELIPRFLRLSALVAIELGIEVRDEEVSDKVASSLPGPTPSTSSTAYATGRMSPSRLAQYNAAREKQRMQANALRPSKEWYMLFAGLLTRAALEGYLTGGWRGTEAVDCLLTVGLGMVDAPESRNVKDVKDGTTSQSGSETQVNDDSEVGDEFKWFDPDGLPSLREAARIIFPSLQTSRTGTYQRREGAEAEYEQEISERLRRFYAIPANTPDLSTHMEDLAWHYPAEPVERAAVRWCEAVAKWRGKPGLENRKPQQSAAMSIGSVMTMESFVHSNPTSPTAPPIAPSQPPFIPSASKIGRAPIEKYFEDPPTWSGNKRRRLSEESRFGTGKRLHG